MFLIQPAVLAVTLNRTLVACSSGLGLVETMLCSVSGFWAETLRSSSVVFEKVWVWTSPGRLRCRTSELLFFLQVHMIGPTVLLQNLSDCLSPSRSPQSEKEGGKPPPRIWGKTETHLVPLSTSNLPALTDVAISHKNTIMAHDPGHPPHCHSIKAPSGDRWRKFRCRGANFCWSYAWAILSSDFIM